MTSADKFPPKFLRIKVNHLSDLNTAAAVYTEHKGHADPFQGFFPTHPTTQWVIMGVTSGGLKLTACCLHSDKTACWNTI